VRRKLTALLAAAVVVVAAAVLATHRGAEPAKRPLKADPAKQFGDDADLMRRLERTRLVTTTR
jgi:hypothetical protein